MKALLLAAGLGTRLRPITDNIPKCLVPVLGRPLIDYWLDLLLGQGIERVLVNTHYHAEAVQAHLRECRWADRIEISHEETLLGTGGTVLANARFFGDRSFLVAHADNLTQFDLGAFRQRHESRPAGVDITMMTFVTDHPQSCGIVEQDEAGVIGQLYEKVSPPRGNLANGAIYIFAPPVLEHMRALGRTVIDISTEILPAYLGRMVGFHNAEYLRDIGTPEMLRRAEAEYAARYGGTHPAWQPPV